MPRPEGAPRQYSYASLNTHLLRVSLSRALHDREWRHAGRIALGWAINLAAFALLVSVFVVYSCVFAERHGGDATVGSLLESWWVARHGHNRRLGDATTGRHGSSDGV